jgi:polyisoprenoid-binding protein YceI
MRVLFLFLPGVLAAQTLTYNIRPAPESRFVLEVFKSKLWEGRKHTFIFDGFSGVLRFDDTSPERSTVQFVVESGSARCVDDWVKPSQIKDIERAAVQDTMAAATYPEISFESTAITTTTSPDKYEILGTLTIRGRGIPVTLAVKASPRGDGIWVEGSGRVRLSEFGLKPPRGVVGVSLFIGTKDEMNVVFELLAIKK